MYYPASTKYFNVNIDNTEGQEEILLQWHFQSLTPNIQIQIFTKLKNLLTWHILNMIM